MSSINRYVFLNCAIMTIEGRYVLKKTDIEAVKNIIKNKFFISAIGHESTAQILSKLLGIQIKVNRINYKHNFSDMCIVFKLRERIPEGKILTIEEIEKIGYDFYFQFLQGDIFYKSNKGPF